MASTAAKAAYTPPVNTFSDNIVIYPTKNKYIFHVGLVGLDMIPLQLEIDADDGSVLLRRNFPDYTPNALKVVSGIDMTSQPASTYLLKITTASRSITKRINI